MADSDRQIAEAKAKSGRDETERRPEAEARAEIVEAIERLWALRRTTGKGPLAEILASRHEGHKY
jgi:hypothetical protein